MYLFVKFQALTEGSEYQYRIAAANIVGEGPFCEPCTPFTAKDPFGIRVHEVFKSHSNPCFVIVSS